MKFGTTLENGYIKREWDFLIPKNLDECDVLNKSIILSESVYQLKEQIQKFDGIPFDELLPEDKALLIHLERVLEQEEQEHLMLKDTYPEVFL